ncbi:MAG: hypothetical protein IJ622_06570 [Bacteroidales bacterium]|nr:hypothetical protein [Bacteroidales bacterium]
MKQHWFHIILFLLLCNALSAQTVISGSVKDTEGETLPNIKVLAYKAGSRVIVAYAGTDNEGRYSLSVTAEADSLDLATSSLFFDKQTKRIANRSQTVDFVLREEVQELKGVTVRARSIEQKGDTLEYVVGSFVQKQDKSIEDVLKRMPGIEVADDGKITYQGLPIQKFYVEGMDLMGGSYASISKNLPHQSVSSVEVYENHQPIKMLEDRVSSEQASINIKLAKDVALTGTAKVGLGAWPFLWNVNLTPMLFSGKVQMLAAYRTNNTGDDLTMYSRMLTVENLQGERPAKLGEELGIKQASTPLFNTNRYLDNQTHLINLNTLFPVNENTTLRVNLYYLNDLRKQSVRQSNTLYLAADTLAYTEQIDNRLRDNQLFGTITLNRNDKAYYLDNKLSFSKAWDNAFGLDVNNGLPISQTLKTPALSVDNDLRLIIPIGKRLLDFTSYIGYGQTPHRLEVEPGQFANLLNDSLAYSKTIQQLNTRQFFADHAVSAIFTAGRFTIRPKAGFLFVERQIASQLTLSDGETEGQSPLVPDAQVKRRNIKPYLTTEVEYKRKRFSAGMDLPLSLQAVTVQSESDSDQMTKLLFNPIVWSRLKLGNFWTLNASARMIHSVENYDSWMDTYLLTDYQDLVLRKAPLSLSRTLSGSLGVQFKEPFISLNADLRYGLGRTHSENMYRYQVGEGGTSLLQVAALPNNHFYQTLSGSIRKYFSPIRTSIGLKGNLLDSKGVALVNEALMNTHSVSYSLSPSLMFKVTEWLNVDYSLNYNKMYAFIDEQKRSEITYWRHFGKAFAFLKRNQTVSLTAEYYRHQGQPYLFVDASYEFSIAKPKLDFEVRWNNIFNSKKYVSYYSGAFSMQETIYILRPMELTASVRFRF